MTVARAAVSLDIRAGEPRVRHGTVYSYTRLVTAAATAYWGLWLLLRSSLDPTLGIAVGGIGLAVTLIETAYVHARFLRAAPTDLK